MSSLLEDQIEFLGRQVGTVVAADAESEIARELDHILAIAVSLYRLLEELSEERIPPGQWSEDAARPLVPLYQSWYAVGARVRDLLRELKRQGVHSRRQTEFMRAMVRAQGIALHFDQLVEAHRRAAAGIVGPTTPIEKLL